MSVELTDGRILLRAPQSRDAATMVEAARESAIEVGRWLPWCRADYRLEEAEDWVAACRASWQREESYPFFMIDAASGQMLGGCALNEIDRLRLRANLGYWVRTSQMGRGIATAAARLAARFGLETLAMQRLEIVAAAGNTASQRVAGKLGAMREGLARNRLRIRDVPHDAFVFSLITADLKDWRLFPHVTRTADEIAAGPNPAQNASSRASRA